MINLAALFHISECNYCYPVSETGLALRLQTACNNAGQVTVSYQNLYDHVSPFKTCEMHLLLSDGLNDLYEAEINVPERRFKYYFTVQNGNEIVYFGSDGPSKEAPAKEGCFYYPCINPDDLPWLPEWAAGETIYQIWTDRFCNGDTSNDPPCTKRWGALPDRSTYYGGDFKGIVEKLPYLKSLGIGVIYLNPIFASPSYHKYDISNYEVVDLNMGGEKGLADVVSKAHEKGIRIVLDGVLNHCSSNHPFFRDLVEKGIHSRFKEWFFPCSFPISMEKCNYDTFAGLVPDMPRFNTANPEVIEYLVNNTVMWTKKLNLDGWRLDVCDEVSHSLLKKLRSCLTEVRPDILIIGEIWNQAGRWMQGDEIHAVTNYKFRQATLRFLQGKGDALTFWRDLSHCKMQIKTPMQPYLINLNSTHDTERIRRALHHDERLTLCAAALVMFMDGMPLIYYGDEVFMDGDVDPDSRRAMDWSSTGSDFAEKYRELANYRGNSVILKRGSTVLAYAEGQTLAILREYAGEKLLCAVNSGPTTKIPLKAKNIILGSGELCKDGLLLPENSWSVWEV